MSRLSALLSLFMGNLLITCLLCTASLVFSYHTWCPIILINPSPTLCLLCLSMTDGHSLFVFFCVCSSSACVRSSAPSILLGLCILTWFSQCTVGRSVCCVCSAHSVSPGVCSVFAIFMSFACPLFKVSYVFPLSMFLAWLSSVLPRLVPTALDFWGIKELLKNAWVPVCLRIRRQ